MSTEAELLRDQRIAEAWERWPDGRLFENAATTRPLVVINDDVEYWAGLKGWIQCAGKGTEPQWFFDKGYAELKPPTPTLPDPSGDLPDGTRVRVTYEGTVTDWSGDSGNVHFGEWSRTTRAYLDGMGATVEVLALPTPPPSALDGKPASLWRDPEQPDQLWQRVDLDQAPEFKFVLIKGAIQRLNGMCLKSNEEYDRPVIARLVPAQVADDE